jgi:NAD(P)-dependent dehydrogenase (short-subunit alcohol dehydrogenase family)
VKRLGEDLLHGPRLEEHIVIVLGVGPGLGLSIAQTFAKRGYTTAILSRTKTRLDAWADALHDEARAFRQSHNLPLGAEGERLSAAFACDALDNASIRQTIDEICAFWPGKKVGTACYNASIRKRGPFLEQRLEQIQEGVQGSILAGFTFAQAVIAKMEAHGEGGSLLVTGATSSTRGREGFAGFAASSKWMLSARPGRLTHKLIRLSFFVPQSQAFELCVRYVVAIPRFSLLEDL